MKEIYIVTSGTYSDYRIHGVFEDKDTADRVAALRDDGYNEASVEVWELNPEVDTGPKDMLPYQVRMDRDGTSDKFERCSADELRWPWMPVGKYTWPWMPVGKYTCVDSGFVIFRMWARDEVHAVKVANERRAALVASGEWTTNKKVWADRSKKT